MGESLGAYDGGNVLNTRRDRRGGNGTIKIKSLDENTNTHHFKWC